MIDGLFDLAHVCDFLNLNIFDRIQATKAERPVTMKKLHQLLAKSLCLPKRYNPHLLQLRGCQTIRDFRE